MTRLDWRTAEEFTMQQHRDPGSRLHTLPMDIILFMAPYLHTRCENWTDYGGDRHTGHYTDNRRHGTFTTRRGEHVIYVREYFDDVSHGAHTEYYDYYTYGRTTTHVYTNGVLTRVVEFSRGGE